MFEGIFILIGDIISAFVQGISIVFMKVYNLLFGEYNDFFDREVNLSLFSENIIFTTTMYEILVFITITIFLVIILRFLIKGTYKIIKKVFGVIRLWND